MSRAAAEGARMTSPDRPIGYGQRVAELAGERPGRTALVFLAPDGSERTLTWGDLNRRVNQMARLLAGHGVGRDSLVAICLPTCAAHVVSAIAAWRLGACTLPLSPQLPDRERREILAVSEAWRPTLMVVEEEPQRPGDLALDGLAALDEFEDGPLPSVVPHPGKAICSGGSTGRPKIILDDRPWQKVPGSGSSLHAFGMRADQTQLITGRLYHNIAFSLTHNGLFEGHTVVLMEKFDAALAVDAIERHRVNFLGMVPVVMQRIARLPGIKERDFSSIDAFYHSGAPCPAWVKRAWLELVDPVRQFDCYGGAEGTGVVAVRGDDWIRRNGTLGKPVDTVLRVLDDAGHQARAGEVGEIFTRPAAGTTTFRYLGSAPPKTTADGLVSLGDMGWVDEDGYLYLADRRVDLIISGGANIYPAEVEGVLSEHPGVADVAVIGIKDEEWGQRVHAVVLPHDVHTPPEPEELREFCRERLIAYKVPKTVELVSRPFRDASGKVRRSLLAGARGGTQSAPTTDVPRPMNRINS